MNIIANRLTQTGISILEQSGCKVNDIDLESVELVSYINENQIHAVVFDKLEQFNAEFVDMCPTLKLVAFKTAITDNSDIQYAKDQGLEVFGVTNATSTAKAELIFAHLLGMVRFLHQSNREMPLEGDMNFELLHDNFLGQELKGKTLGIVGMELDAVATAKIAIAMGMKVVMTDYEPRNVLIPIEFYDGQSVEFYIEASTFDDVITESDFIVVNTSLSSNLVIGESQFKKMKKGVGIVNLTRGAIDEVALINAIQTKKVAFAGLDSFENQPTPAVQLLMNPELSLSPNIANKTYEAQIKISEELAQKIVESLV